MVHTATTEDEKNSQTSFKIQILNLIKIWMWLNFVCRGLFGIPHPTNQIEFRVLYLHKSMFNSKDH